MTERSGPRLRATLVSLFPDCLRSYTEASILGRAIKDGALAIDGVQIRDFAQDKHRRVDDSPCGGGPGMIMKIDVVAPAIEAAIASDSAQGDARKRRVILLDAAGPVFNAAHAQRLSAYDHLVFVCGRYEGIDARVHALVDETLSLGDFVLTGGELAAGVILDATARFLPGVLGNESSAQEESHAEGLLEHRQYTRPIQWREQAVPEVLLSGDHARIAKARRKDALLRTQKNRPELYAAHTLDKADQKLLHDDKLGDLSPVSLSERKDAS